MKISPRNILHLIMCLVMVPVGMTGAMAQDIASIAKSDPLIITGAVGTQNTFNWTSGGLGYASPYSNSVYANLNFNIYGISMPFSFYYTNDNASFTLPQISFNVSPSYKGWTLYLGQHAMPFSQYVFAMPFNGVGIEYRPQTGKGIRFGTFYGTLKKAINVEPDFLSVKSPQYKRTGYGLKLGFGSGRSYIDLYLFRAKDDLSSIDEYWYDRLNAQDNIVVGAKSRLALGKHLSLTTNFATSLFSTDIRSRVVEMEAVKRFDNIFDVRYSTQMRWAGDATLNAVFGKLNASLNYKIVQPEYTTLGVNYLTSNYHSLGVSASTVLKGLSFTGTFNAQADNLNGDQLYTNYGYVYNASASTILGRNLIVSANYFGYQQTQGNGMAQVTDSSRVHRKMDSFSITPTYNIPGNLISQSISLSGNWTSNKDLSPMATGLSDVETMALGGNYSLTVMPIETTFAASISHQETDGYNLKYKTTIYSLSASRSFLKDKSLNLSASASLTDNNLDKSVNNLSAGGYLTASYTLKDVHQFALSGSMNRFVTQDITLGEDNMNGVMSYTCSLSYSYTFTVFHLKRQAEKGKKRYTSDFMRRPKQKIPVDPNKRY